MDQTSALAPVSDVVKRRFERIGLTLVVLLCLGRWISVEYRLAEQGIRASLAVETTGIFEDFIDMDAGSERMANSIRDYYPSGTKQVTGSRLDLLVERCRRLAIRLVDCNRATAAADRERKE
jgi:hypothetical protein